MTATEEAGSISTHPSRSRRTGRAPRLHARRESAGRGRARRKPNQRTARENIDDLVDPGTFIEYGSLALAAQRRRRTVDDLIRNTPADGVSGVATVNADKFGAERARCMVIAYDYTVLAGTQGHMNHKKIDRMLRLAEQWRLPLVFYAEGGGGRPGDTDRLGITGLDGPSFVQFARNSQAWCRWSASSPAIALPATPRCSAAAT